jgi:hypothetical protein
MKKPHPFADVPVARIQLEPDTTDKVHYFHRLHRSPVGQSIVRQQFLIAELTIPDYKLEEAIDKVRADCANHWYNSIMDASIYVISYNNKHLVLPHPQAM